MTHYSPYRNMAAVVLLLTLLPACKKFLDVPPSDTVLSSAKVFADQAQADQVRAGMYADIMGNQGLLNGLVSRTASYYSDDLTESSSSDDTPFALNTLSADNALIKTIWGTGYRTIHNANVIIEGVNGPGALPDAVRTRMKGEASFMRALANFYLVNLFGDVPLVLTTDVEAAAVLPRTPADKVYAQIVTDLQEAEQSLPSYYGSDPTLPDSRIYPTRYAAAALLARVWLTRGNVAGAVQQASFVIDSGGFRLTTDLGQTFLAGSGETIFHLAPLPELSYNTQEGLFFLSASPALPPPCYLTDGLADAFDSGDARKTSWLRAIYINGRQRYSPYKYKTFGGKPPFVEYNIVLRLSEQFLIRAEARLPLGDLAGARQDINMVRARAGLAPLSDSLTAQQLLQAVIHERRTELFTEWGLRWLDLLRWQGDVLAGVKGSGWPADKVRWPIPADQLTLNPYLVQNPGY